ncbi:hypothetical protein HWV62_22209 [Athelia sp. TMB]|nr:hypothetical protein HWV62_22209 [Athelia sp. TMB]
MFYNTLRFLALVVQPRPSFKVPPSASEPFYYYNTASHGRVASQSTSYIENEPSLSFSFASSISLAGSLGGVRYFGVKKSLKELPSSERALNSASRFIEAIDYAFPPALPLKRRISSVQELISQTFIAPFSTLSPILEDYDRLRNPSSPISLSCSSTSESVYSEEDLQMRLMDRASGVFINKASQSPVPAEDFEFYDLGSSFVLSSYQNHRQAELERTESSAISGILPSMMLTLPTPEIPILSAFSPAETSAGLSKSRVSETTDGTTGEYACLYDNSATQELPDSSETAIGEDIGCLGTWQDRGELERETMDILDIPVVDSRSEQALNSSSLGFPPTASDQIWEASCSSPTAEDPRLSIMKVHFRNDDDKALPEDSSYQGLSHKPIPKTVVKKTFRVIKDVLRTDAGYWNAIDTALSWLIIKSGSSGTDKQRFKLRDIAQFLMARTNKFGPGSKPRPKFNAQKSNASGYAKRHSAKAKLLNGGSSDVYEYTPDPKTRRSKVALDIGRDEAAEFGMGHGGGSDDAESDEEDVRMKPRLIGETGEGEMIDSADDEELDSDAAFEESDEERFAGFSFKSSQKNKKTKLTKKRGVNFVDVDLDEDGPIEVHDDRTSEEEIEEGDSDDFIDVLAAETVRPRKRRIMRERNEAGAENEFSAQANGSTKLNLEDLLAPLSSQSSNLQGLKKSAKVLASMSGPQTLSAPLPQRTQERVDREAAYEQTKEEVDKWSGTMKRIQEAEHLSFPLQAQPVGKVSNLELAAKFKPTTDLESSIDKLLKSAKMRDEDIQQTESLAMNHLSVAEVAARRAELRKMRELMFRAEVKAKRVSKIKSKAYRRIKKKEREKMAATLGEAGGMDEDDEDVRLKREVERARERATLRHKNTGKWAKSMKHRGELNVDERREISEMLDRGEKLRRKIRGDKGSGSEDQESESDDEEEVGGDGLARIKSSAFEELAKLDGDDEVSEAGLSGKSKGVFKMKFMQDAMARSQRQTEHMVDDFIKEMGGREAASDDELEVADDEERTNAAISRTGGRVIYRPAALSGQISARPIAASDTSSVTLQSADLLLDSPPPESSTSRPVPIPSSSEANPWLAPRESVSKAPRKKNEVVIGKDSATLDKSKNKLKKQIKKLDQEKEKAKDDAVVEISMDSVMALDQPSGLADGKSKGKMKTQVPAPGAVATAQDDSDTNSEIDEQEKVLASKGKKKGKLQAFEQRDLVARAFAGDNVVQAFEDAKRREMAEDAPKAVDTTIPGWGAWGGSGTRKQPTKPQFIKKIAGGAWGGSGTRKQPTKPQFIKKIAGVDPTTRADYGKKHIIISEKRDKKAAKYLVKDLPYPYTSKAQFERSIETPLGTEWNTRAGFQRATLPKVVKKVYKFWWLAVTVVLTRYLQDGDCHQSFGKIILVWSFGHVLPASINV